jgi:hypothetical protein
MQLRKPAVEPHTSRLRDWRTAPLCAVLIAGLSACGGGGSAVSTPSTSPQACTSATCGQAVMTLTDAAGDFLAYKVNLVSLQLKQSDGTVVETLPATTAVDFAQLVNLGEVLSSKQIPKGNYVSASVTVDFTGAQIMVDDGTGAAVAVSPVDSTGAALGKLTLDVQLDKNNALSIKEGKASRIAFDFNLLASNTVDLTAKTVTVNPVLVASVVAPDHKELRIRGALVSVDTAAKSYVVNVKPFEEKSADTTSPLTVLTTDTTTFEIDGKPYTGADGLAALAALPADTVAVAFGSLAADQSFTAKRVRAGTSVGGGGMDHLSGDVIARDGNTLTVHAAHLEDESGDDSFQAKDAIVTIADATAVLAEGQASADPAHTIDEISVGSRINAFGTATKDANGKVTLEASAGRVRLEFTRLAGTLAEVGTNQVTLTLSSIDRMPVTLFNFKGTGATVDSDPAKYVVDTGALPLDAFTAGSAAQSVGFVASFGKAPPDFKAVTLSNGAASVGDDNGGDDNGGDDNGGGDHQGGGNGGHDSAELEIDWGQAGATAPFKTVDATRLDLDIANASIGEHHKIEAEPKEFDLKTLATDPSIVPDASTTALFAIGHSTSHKVDNFNSFADFEAALATGLNGTVTALRMVAEGSYDEAANTFTARHLVVQLKGSPSGLPFFSARKKAY